MSEVMIVKEGAVVEYAKGLDLHGLGKCWEHREVLRKLRLHVLCYGPPGTTKTTLAMEMALAGQDLQALTLNKFSDSLEVWGGWCPDGKGGRVWMDGPGKIAWDRGGHLVLNEIGDMEDDSPLLCLLDDPRVAQTTLADGTTIQPQESAEGHHFRCVATMNDELGELREAVVDRFMPVLVDLPSPEALGSLPLPLQQMVVNNYSDAREGGSKLLFTFRDVLRLRGLLDGGVGLGMEIAVQLTWGHRGQKHLGEVKDKLKTAGVWDVLREMAGEKVEEGCGCGDPNCPLEAADDE